MRLIFLLLALRATSADENDVYASDDNFVSPTQTADAAEDGARVRRAPTRAAAGGRGRGRRGVRGVGGSATGARARDPAATAGSASLPGR